MPVMMAFMFGALVMILQVQRKHFCFLKSHDQPWEFSWQERLSSAASRKTASVAGSRQLSRAPAPWMLLSTFVDAALFSAPDRPRNPRPTGVQPQRHPHCLVAPLPGQGLP